MNIIKSVGAIIENDNNEILCALYADKNTNEKLWEFPKLNNESVEDSKEFLNLQAYNLVRCQLNIEDSSYESNYHDNIGDHEDVYFKCKIKKGYPILLSHVKHIWLKREFLNTINWHQSAKNVVNILENEQIINKVKNIEVAYDDVISYGD